MGRQNQSKTLKSPVAHHGPTRPAGLHGDLAILLPLMNAPVDVSFFARAAKPLTSYRKYWAARFGTAKFLPTTRGEMDALGDRKSVV